MSLPKLLLSIFTGTVLVLFFQNCQKAKMESKGTTDNPSLARLNEVDLGLPPGTIPDSTATPTPSPDPIATPTPGPTATPTPNPTPPVGPDPVCLTDDGDAPDSDSNSHDHGRHAHHKSSYGHHMCDDDSSDDNSGDDCKDPKKTEEGHREYICDIHKPGNSHALGITESEALLVKHQGVKMLCMSRPACEVIAAAAFPGAKAEARGFCKVDSNKNVSHVSDARLQVLVDKWIAEHPAP